MATIILIRAAARVATSALVAAAGVLAVVNPAAAATPVHIRPVTAVDTPSALPFGPATCQNGFVWREAFDGDTVCVVPATRAQAKRDNTAGPGRINAADPVWGPQACQQGFVWRLARPGDLVCVTPATRAQAAADNKLAASRRATESGPADTPSHDDGLVEAVFEVTGSGVADDLAVDSGPVKNLNHVQLPFRKVSRVPASIDLLQIHVSGVHDHNTACRITLDGRVVSTGQNDCVFQG